MTTNRSRHMDFRKLLGPAPTSTALVVWRTVLSLTLGLLILPAQSFPAETNSTSPPRPPPNPRAAVAHARISRWQPIFQGVEMCVASTKRPRPLQVRAVRINLRASGIQFLVTPSNGEAPKDTGARTTSEFLREFNCQVALNGSVFDVFAKHRGDPMDVEGLSLSRGDLYSPPNQYDALLIATNNRAWIDRAPVEVRSAFNGLSGFYALLVNGQNNGTAKVCHPRSAVGLDRRGRHLILMTIDGRQPGYSEGVTTAEAAEWMRKLGAYNALNLDGGGSTALVIESTNGLPLVLNCPCGPPVGTERRVANHLGMFAQKLPKSKGSQSASP